MKRGTEVEDDDGAAPVRGRDVELHGPGCLRLGATQQAPGPGEMALGHMMPSLAPAPSWARARAATASDPLSRSPMPSRRPRIQCHRLSRRLPAARLPPRLSLAPPPVGLALPPRPLRGPASPRPPALDASTVAGRPSSRSGLWRKRSVPAAGTAVACCNAACLSQQPANPYIDNLAIIDRFNTVIFN
jgi:hypothetical protein